MASKEQTDTGLLLHSLRLVGNSCADTGRVQRLLLDKHRTKTNTHSDENRGIVIDGEYISAVIRHFVNPDLIHVAIPVIYNICMDYGKTFCFPMTLYLLCADLNRACSCADGGPQDGVYTA